MGDFELLDYRDGKYCSQLVSVIRTALCRGAGTEEDRCRRVIQWHEVDGTFIAEYDPCAKPGPSDGE